MDASQVLAVYQQAEQAVELRYATPEQELLVSLWQRVQSLEKAEKQQAHKISILECQNSEVQTNEATNILSRFSLKPVH
jgi:hypothetical protein